MVQKWSEPQIDQLKTRSLPLTSARPVNCQNNFAFLLFLRNPGNGCLHRTYISPWTATYLHEKKNCALPNTHYWFNDIKGRNGFFNSTWQDCGKDFIFFLFWGVTYIKHHIHYVLWYHWTNNVCLAKHSFYSCVSKWLSREKYTYEVTPISWVSKKL